MNEKDNLLRHIQNLLEMVADDSATIELQAAQLEQYAKMLDDERATVASLRAQIEELIAGALVRAHRQCIAVDALTAILDLATNEEMRKIAQNAVAQIGEVTHE